MVRALVLPRRQARLLAAAIAALRLALGVTAYLVPSAPAAPWVGVADARRPAVKLLARTLGGRDVALGLGLLLAWARGAPLRSWAGAGALADTGDLVATLLVLEDLPRRTRLLIVALTAGAALGGLACLPVLEPAPPAP